MVTLRSRSSRHSSRRIIGSSQSGSSSVNSSADQQPQRNSQRSCVRVLWYTFHVLCCNRALYCSSYTMSSSGTPTASITTATRSPRRLNLMYESLTSPTILPVTLCDLRGPRTGEDLFAPAVRGPHWYEGDQDGGAGSVGHLVGWLDADGKEHGRYGYVGSIKKRSASVIWRPADADDDDAYRAKLRAYVDGDGKSIGLSPAYHYSIGGDAQSRHEVVLTTLAESADGSPVAATAAWTQPISSLLLRFAAHHNRRHPSAPLDAASLQLEDRGGERFLPTTPIGAAVDAVDAVGAASASTTKGTARAAFTSASLDLFVRIDEQLKAKNSEKQKQKQRGTGSGSPARRGRGAGGGAKGEAEAGGSTGEEAKSTGEERATGEAKNQDNGERSSDDPVPPPRPAFNPLLLRSRSAPVSPASRSSQLSTANLAATLRRVGGGRRRAWLRPSHGATGRDAGGQVGDLAGEAKQSKGGEDIVAREGPPQQEQQQQQQQQQQQEQQQRKQEQREAREAEEDQQSRTSPSSTAAFLRSRTTVGDRYRENNTHSASSTSSASSSSASPASSASLASSASASASNTGLLRPPDDSRSGVLDNGLCFYIQRHDKPRKEVRMCCMMLRDAMILE